MATLRELIIKISANSQSFQNEISRASRLGQDYHRTMQNGGRQAALAQRETQRALSAVTSQLNATRLAALNMAGAFAGAYATTNLIRLADSYNSLSARVKLATGDTADFSSAQKGLMDISQRTGSAFADNVALFSRASTSLREWGFGTQDILKLTDALANGLQVSGASAEETSSLIVQLSQALGRGVLRGQDFNSVAQSGQRIMKALADGMGVAQKDLKGMADAGQLTTDKIVPALISQLDKLKTEFNAMPNSVSAASIRIQNAFMEWVGGANQASGATAGISGVLDGVAKNIDSVATAAGALVAVGISRYFGNWTKGIVANTGELAKNYQAQVRNADAQLNGARMTQRKAIANAEAASSAFNVAREDAKAARGSNASALATQNLIQKRKEMIAANAVLVQSNRAVTASEAQIGKLTSATSLLRRNLSLVGSLIGGWPGALMLGAGAWYIWNQHQEQARQSAIQYASTLDEVVAKAKQMSEIQIKGSISDSGESIDALKNKLVDLKSKQDATAASVEEYTTLARQMGVANDQNNGYVKNAAKAQREYDQISRDVADTTEQLNKAVDSQKKLQDELEKKVTASAAAFQKLKSEIIGAYNVTDAMSSAMATTIQFMDELKKKSENSMPAQVNEAYQKFIQQQKEGIALLQKEGVERAKLKALQDAIKQGAIKTDNQGNVLQGQDKQIAAIQGNAATDFNLTESHRKPRGKSEAEKTEDVYKRLIKQQQEQIALAGQSTELAKTKYQVTQGELAAFSEAQKSELLLNSAALDHVNAVERLKSLTIELLTPEEALLNTTRERIKLMNQAAPATEEYRKTMERISKASVQEAPKFGGLDSSIGGASGELIRVADAHKDLEKWHKTQLDMQKKLLDEKEINEQTYAERVAEINKSNNSKMSDIQSAYTQSSLAMFSDMTGQTAQLLQGMGREGTAAYKTLFLASKAAALAQSIISTEVAANKALELGPIFGVPASLAIRATGYASTAIIAGQTLAGMAHDGIDRVPETGTWLLQKGERVVTASTSAKLDATLERVQQVRQNQANAGDVNISYNLTGKPDDTMMQAMDAHGRKLAKQIKGELTAQVITPSNDFGRALHGHYSRTRRS